MKNGMFFAIITALCFTTLEPVSKLFAGEINPYAITAIRFFIGSLVLLPFTIREMIQKKIKLGLSDCLIMSGLGVLFICISMVLLQVAVKIADSPALIAIIFSSNSIFTIALSAVFLNNKLTKAKVLGIILCIIGVIVSADFRTGTNLISVLLALLASVTFSIYTILCKKYMTRMTGIIQTGITFLSGSVILMIVLSLCGISVFEGISASNAAEVLYVSIVVTGIGYWAYFSAMKHGGAQTAAITFLIKPILTPFATFVINGIVPNVSIIIAVILVVVGAALAGDVIKFKRGDI